MQPVGLVVSPPVMVDAQVVPDRNVSGRQREFIALLERDDTGATARWRAPDLLRDLTVERPNQVWAADICYLPRASPSGPGAPDT